MHEFRFIRRRRRRVITLFVVAASTMVADATARAAIIYGGPAYDSSSGTGYQNPTFEGPTVGDAFAVVVADKYVGGKELGYRGLLWNASGSTTELVSLGTDSTGSGHSLAIAMNPGGTIVGESRKYSGNTNLNDRAVHWDAAGTVVTELGNLGTNTSGSAASDAFSINAAGTTVGIAHRYSGNTDLGGRPVRWNAGSTTAIELGNLGTSTAGRTDAAPLSINTGGTAAGHAEKYGSGGIDLGLRAVRWDAGGTAITELGNLGTNSSGVTSCNSYTINDNGTIAGIAEKYSGGVDLGTRAVRWDSGTTAATELGTLGADTSGRSSSFAVTVNAGGAIIGYAEKYVGNTPLGYRAVRWDAGGTVASELGNLGTDTSGSTYSAADAINDFGTAVGYAHRYNGSTDLGQFAVLWSLDGVAVDLNTLLSPSDAAQWALTNANAISNTNWVTGTGNYDPDGAGPLPAYSRAFLIQVPEPTGFSFLTVCSIGLFRRTRKR